MDPFTEWLESISKDEMEPFCPFSIMYCDKAYSEACRTCSYRRQFFDE